MEQALVESWTRESLKDPHRLPDKRSRVCTMFSGIAGSYDLLNHILSVNLDRRWRKKAVELADIQHGDRVLDICCGTGDLAFAFARAKPEPDEVLGVDFVENMLKIARDKQKKLTIGQSDLHNYSKIKWLRADAQSLPFEANRFDRVGCAFGIRNLQDVSTGLRQAHRVLKDKGRLIILEFAIPKNPLIAWIYQCYFRFVLPMIAGLICSNRKDAYRYLPDSVWSFDTEKLLVVKLKEVGFDAIRVQPLCFGAVLAFVAQK